MCSTFLSAILGVHSMLTQSQSHWAEKTEAGKALRGSGLKKYKPGRLSHCCFVLVIIAIYFKCLIEKVLFSELEKSLKDSTVEPLFNGQK